MSSNRKAYMVMMAITVLVTIEAALLLSADVFVGTIIGVTTTTILNIWTEK